VSAVETGVATPDSPQAAVTPTAAAAAEVEAMPEIEADASTVPDGHPPTGEDAPPLPGAEAAGLVGAAGGAGSVGGGAPATPGAEAVAGGAPTVPSPRPGEPADVAEPPRSGTGAPAELFFEDLTPGLTFDLGVVRVDGDEMVAFARRFDPQWYHVDPERAAASHHGGLIASGFYTVSLFMRAYVDHVLARAAADASPGLEELRWLAPVRAGDRLAVRLDVMGSRPSTARPGLGTVSLTGTMFRLGPDGEPEQEVLRTRFRGWFALRPAGPGQE
jgi:acyl dehydratase